jgi:hypothetical protein
MNEPSCLRAVVENVSSAQEHHFLSVNEEHVPLVKKEYMLHIQEHGRKHIKVASRAKRYLKSKKTKA